MAHSHTRLLAALACAYAAAPPKRVTLAVANERDATLRCTLGADKLAIAPRAGHLLKTDVPTELVCGGLTTLIDGDGYVVARVGDDAIAVGDANDVEFARHRPLAASRAVV